ncbi:MAG: SCO family protein [Pseudobdellovibrionaceae bacterium]|jgi:protein SCO1/2|nr:SCO family protein [Pseudobdellovibrionaceae bacterium]
MSPASRLKRFFVLALIGTLIGAVIGLVSGVYTFRDDVNEMAGVAPKTTSVPLAASGLDAKFALVDQDGFYRTQDEYADKYKLVYFGFTYCPAICPTELSKMAEAYLALSPDMQKNLQPIFITVDPERDTPEVMKGYVSLFMPQLVGLTGSLEQIEDAKKSFKVYAAKVPDEADPETYTMDHTSLIYFLSPENVPLAFFKTADSSEVLTQRIFSVMSKNQDK